MKTNKHFLDRMLPAALVILGAAVLTLCNFQPASAVQTGSSQKQNVRPREDRAVAESKGESTSSIEDANFVYEFTQPQFHIRHILIEHDAAGSGQITFERLNEEVPITEPIKLSPTVLTRIADLWEAAKFLDTDTSYQSDKQFPHLGNIRLKMARGERSREAEFNWTNNNSVSALVTEYRRIADQAIFVFDMSVARANQPLNSPKLMERLEILLRRNSISDPQQLVPLLQDISTDEHIPLIARHHADRLLKKLKK